MNPVPYVYNIYYITIKFVIFIPRIIKMRFFNSLEIYLLIRNIVFLWVNKILIIFTKKIITVIFYSGIYLHINPLEVDIRNYF